MGKICLHIKLLKWRCACALICYLITQQFSSDTVDATVKCQMLYTKNFAFAK